MSEIVTDETPGRPSRRKACDLCFKKKIRCDRTKPRCSHCKIYKSPACTFTPLTRTPNPKTIPTSRADVLEAKLHELEARLRRVESAKSSDQSNDTPPGSQGTVAVAGGAAGIPTTDMGHLLSDVLELTPESLTELVGSDTCETQSGGYVLPSLPEILPLISNYFATSNRVMPLFHEPTFLRMLRDWYSTPISQQSPAVWGAINIVLALSRRHTYLDISSPRGTLDIYVRNAQSVLNHLVTRDEDLLGIQVVIGLALIFYGTSDPKPATVLIATAVRLAHALRISTRQRSQDVEPELDTQRQRIFWVLYTLDRDIAMRIGQPAMINESDIDLQLPEENPCDDVGVLCAENGTRINFFRKRVQLAWIEGKVYEWMFSVRARKLPPAKKEENKRRAARALEQWYATLPAEFKPELLPDIADVPTFRAFTILHFTHMQTLAIIHQAYSFDAEWLVALRTFSERVVDSSSRVVAPLPQSWNALVVKGRDCLRMFSCLPGEDLYVLWSVTCAFFSSLIFLAVNNLVDPHHSFIDQDQNLMDFALRVLERLVDETQNEKVASMRAACAELVSKAQIVVDRARSRRLQGDSFDVDQFDGFLTTADPAYGLGTAAGGSDAAQFFQRFTISSGGLDPDLFDNWLDNTQFFDTQGPLAGSVAVTNEKNPSFGGVVSALMKSTWY